MSGIILPNASSINPAVEVAMTEIDGQSTQYFVKPGVGPVAQTLAECCQLSNLYGVLIHALVRKTIERRDQLAEVDAERKRDKAQLEVLQTKLSALKNRVNGHGGALDLLQDVAGIPKP